MTKTTENPIRFRPNPFKVIFTVSGAAAEALDALSDRDALHAAIDNTSHAESVMWTTTPTLTNATRIVTEGDWTLSFITATSELGLPPIHFARLTRAETH